MTDPTRRTTKKMGRAARRPSQERERVRAEAPAVPAPPARAAAPEAPRRGPPADGGEGAAHHDGSLGQRVDELEAALAAEKEGRDGDAAFIGEMLARVSAIEAQLRTAQTGREAAEAQARLAEDRARELEERASMLADRVRQLEDEGLRLRSVHPPPFHSVPSENLPKSTEYADRIHALEELCADAAALFEELERREMAVAEFRTRALRDARAALLRSIGKPVPSPGGAPDPRPPPLPVVDITDLAEAYESTPPSSKT